MAVSPSLYSSHSTFSHAFKYDVFLSFRGSDTRHGFTGNLYKALDDRGINTFIDDEDLQRGDEITPSLMKAIQESRIAIPIFSVNYATSSFCLDELVHIIDCFKAKGRLVLPVFYNVDPSHVRHQTGTYGEALAKHEAKFNNNKKKLKDNMERIQKWKIALNQVANLSGYHYKHGDGYEHKFIGKIIEEVSKKIDRVLLPIADYPVGLESQVLKVNLLLDVESGNGVHFVGIHGMGGLGKTTLALAVYNSIADHFEGLCFLENVRENSNKHGLQHLQSILLYETLGEKDIKLTSIKKGIAMIKHKLQRKKVLLILDDVDKQEHLQAIVGEPNWFGPGSRVIVTTRDKHLLECHNVKKIFEVKKLDMEDALQLLRWKAFKSEQVDPSYLDVLNRAVTYASGLPLALEVIGSSLYGKDIEEWESALNSYARIPINDILKVLKISFDALEEEEKNVFLDIACCFKGYGLEEVNEILCVHHGDNMKHHIKVLVDKSLIKIVSSYKITLHDLTEDMGKEIVRQESPKEFGKRSRLWFHKDVVQVLKHNKGSNKIEIIFLQFPFSKEEEEEVKWDGDAFKKMKNLRTIIIKNGSFSQGPSHLPNSLRVLEWNKYPSKHLPSGFCPVKLVICKLSNSPISSLGFLLKKEFVNLSNLNFDQCEFLTEIPDISCLECLESLSFSLCKSLHTIDNSVGSLKKLKRLDAWGCKKLRNFPPLKMTSLEELELSDCDRLESFPEISVGSLKKLKSLRVEGCRELRRFPPLEMTSLEYLYLSNCDRLESFPEILIGSLKKLKILDAHGCKELRSFSPLEMSSLEELYLSGCDRLESFPEISVGSLEKLKRLDAHGCKELRSFPPLEMTSLVYLDLSGCDRLESFPEISIGSLKKLKRLDVHGCKELRSFPLLEMSSLEELDLSGCDRLESFSEISVGSLKKLKSLRARGCRELRSFPPLEMTLLEELDLSNCDRLESFPEISVRSLKKLKSLRAQGCRELRSFPPLEMTSLEKLDLSYCDRLESFPEISVKMENMTNIFLLRTPIKKLPRSFRNLTKLKSLYMTPSSLSWDVGTSLFQSIITMPELTEIRVHRIAGWVMPKESEVDQNVCTSKVQSIELEDCRLTDEFFLVVATWFANVKKLILSEGHFIIIPECIKECCFLEKLELIKCWDLQEIRAIPQNLKHLEAIDCPNMTDSCKSMLLKQERHETRNTHFIGPYTPVPEWFHHQSRGPSVSFWFRNNLPELVLCVTLPDQYPLSLLEFYLFINGNKCSYSSFQYFCHIHLFNLNEVKLKRNLNEVLSENEWNFAEFKCLDPDVVIESGIHVLKQESGMKDILFTSAYRKRKLEDDLDISESPNHQLLKRHKSLDMDISGTDIVQQQHMGFWSRMWNQACSCFSFLLPCYSITG